MRLLFSEAAMHSSHYKTKKNNCKTQIYIAHRTNNDYFYNRILRYPSLLLLGENLKIPFYTKCLKRNVVKTNHPEVSMMRSRSVVVRFYESAMFCLV